MSEIQQASETSGPSQVMTVFAGLSIAVGSIMFLGGMAIFAIRRYQATVSESKSNNEDKDKEKEKEKDKDNSKSKLSGLLESPWFYIIVGAMLIAGGVTGLSSSKKGDSETAGTSGSPGSPKITRKIKTSINRTVLRHSILLHSEKEIYDDEAINISSSMVNTEDKITIIYNKENTLIVNLYEKTVTLDDKNIEQVDKNTDLSKYINYIKPSNYQGDTIKFIVTFTNGEKIAIEIIAEKTIKCSYNQIKINDECVNLEGMSCSIGSDNVIRTTYNGNEYIVTTASASIRSDKAGPSVLHDNGSNMECKQICDKNEIYDEEEKICKMDAGRPCTDMEVFQGDSEISKITFRHILDDQGKCVVDICDTAGLDLNGEACNASLYENVPHPDGVTGYARLKNGCCVKRVSVH